MFIIGLLSVISEAGAALQSYAPAIVEFEDETAIDELKEAGVIIWRQRADMALVLFPRKNTYQANISNENKSNRDLQTNPLNSSRIKIEYSKVREPAMDVARTHYDADMMHQGEAALLPYTGKNVVVGFCDIGFDPMHINFFDEDGNNRVKRFIIYSESDADRKELSTVSEYEAQGTDDKSYFHATHVAGIMAGSCKLNGYWGMAPEAEIVATTSELTDVGLLMGVEDVIEYAKSVGKPAVVNLSVAGYNGPHDGTTLFNKYMALLGEEAIICMSAGNSGRGGYSHQIDFTQDCQDWMAQIKSKDWCQFAMLGCTEAWSRDSSPIGVDVIINDNDNGYRPVMICSSAQDGEYKYVFDSAENEEFAKYYEGTLTIEGGIDARNGRWHTSVDYGAITKEKQATDKGNWARYSLSLRFKGAPGVHADIQNDGQFSILDGYSGYTAPSGIFSISDMATGDNVVSVGMYVNRDKEPLITGVEQTFSYTPGYMHPSSGYGTSVFGKRYPMTCAPGAYVISSYSGIYLSNSFNEKSKCAAGLEIEGKRYYWGNQTGTSMSSPYTAGTIACWLEADPTLDFSRVSEIIEATNRQDYPDQEDPRNGLGRLDPMAGLRMVLASGTMNCGTIKNCNLKYSIANNILTIFNPDNNDLECEIITLDGTQILNNRYSGLSIIDLNIDSLSKGCYILKAYPQSGAPLSVKFMR